MNGPNLKPFFTQNRRRVRERLLPGALVLLNANDIQPTSADGSLPLQANPDLFYLSGISQEETILLFAPDAQDEKQREILFLREPNAHSKSWEGHKLSKDDGQRISGIENVRWVSEFPRLFHRLMCESTNVYLNSNEHPGASFGVPSRDQRFVQNIVSRYPLHRYHRLARILHELRAVKAEAELALLKQAISVTHKGFIRALRKLKPGMNECAMEAEFAHEFIRNQARFAFTPIIAGGANACVPHYSENRAILRAGDLLLLDVAARYGNYNADVTRAFPVNGEFTRRQRSVYGAVLRALRAVTKAAVKGKLHRDWLKEADQIMARELCNLGLLKRSDLRDPEQTRLRKYFHHSVGHPLGLDVHDVSLTAQPFAPGWVLAVEPGIYIREEGLGIRLEDDILVTDGDPVNLTANIPIETDDIEEWMGRNKAKD